MAKNVVNTDYKNIRSKIYSYDKKYNDRMLDENPLVKQAYNNERLKDARKTLDKASEKFRDYYENDKVEDKYIKKAAKIAYDAIGPDRKGMTYEDMYKLYKDEDLDQGINSSLSLYAKDRGITKKDMDRLYSAQREYTNACKDVAEQLLGKYGNISNKESNNYKKAKHIVSDTLENAAFYDNYRFFASPDDYYR